MSATPLFFRVRKACAMGFALGMLALPAVAGVADPDSEPQRVVSLNPSLTAIVLALGARNSLVGVDEYSARQQAEVADLPRVGGLFNPSLEAVVALSPDQVLLVPSAEQRDFRQRLEALDVPVSTFENQRFAEVLENISRVGRLLDRPAEATKRIAEIRRVESAIRESTREAASPRTLVVLQRDPLFVVGRDNFVAEMLTAVGGDNLGDAFVEPYPRIAPEWVVENAPEVLIDMDPDGADALEFWSRWPTLPAVKEGRIVSLDAEVVTLPGPWLDRALLSLAEALHGPVVTGQLRQGSPKRIEAPVR